MISIKSLLNDTLIEGGKYSHTKVTKIVVIGSMLLCTFYTVYKAGALSEWLLASWLTFIAGDRFLKMKQQKVDPPAEPIEGIPQGIMKP